MISIGKLIFNFANNLQLVFLIKHFFLLLNFF